VAVVAGSVAIKGVLASRAVPARGAAPTALLAKEPPGQSAAGPCRASVHSYGSGVHMPNRRTRTNSTPAQNDTMMAHGRTLKLWHAAAHCGTILWLHTEQLRVIVQNRCQEPMHKPGHSSASEKARCARSATHHSYICSCVRPLIGPSTVKVSTQPAALASERTSVARLTSYPASAPRRGLQCYECDA
jgi:hypothetical protein